MSNTLPRLQFGGLARQDFGPFDLAVRAGECVAVTGRSGTGKSLLLRMIADLDPHQGEVWLDGVAQSSMKSPVWRRNVMYCAAEAAWWHKIVGSHFPKSAPLQSAGRLDLPPEIFKREIRLCSTGERQRLSLLRALNLKPSVLLLDEPTGPLDAESTALVEAALRKHLRSGAAIVMVTHDLAQVPRMADRHLVLAAGRLSPA